MNCKTTYNGQRCAIMVMKGIYNVSSSMTVSSRSTKMARGTCFSVPFSLTKVLNTSSVPTTVLSLGICSYQAATKCIRKESETLKAINSAEKKSRLRQIYGKEITKC